MTEPLPISCYIRTLNERRMIGPVIAAAAKVADEVIVVDSGSTDGTRQIAAEAGARVIEQDWLGNGHQKRVGEDACRHDWLLDLDADEVVSDALAAEIHALWASGSPESGLCRLKLVIVPPVGAPWEGFGLSRRAKLYDRRRFRMPAHAAWDQIPAEQQGDALDLQAPLYHHAFDSVADLIRKTNRSSGVRAEELRLKGRGVLVLRILFGLPFNFLKRYFLNGMFRGGIYGFAVALTLSFGKWLRDVKMLERWHREARQDRLS